MQNRLTNLAATNILAITKVMVVTIRITALREESESIAVDIIYIYSVLNPFVLTLSFKSYPALKSNVTICAFPSSNVPI